MEILAIIIAFLALILGLAKYLIDRKERIQNRKLEQSDLKDEIIKLLSRISDLNNKLDQKFTAKYLLQLKKELDENQYAQIKNKIEAIKAVTSLESTELGKSLILQSDELEINGNVGISSKELVRLHRGFQNVYNDAKQLMAARVRGGIYMPVDDELS